ncbi:MAG: hypothetical protein Q9170_006348 [Blastenia crenularia]
MPDLVTLYNLIIAYTALGELFKTRYQEILTNTLRNSASTQFAAIISSIWVLCQEELYNYAEHRVQTKRNLETMLDEVLDRNWKGIQVTRRRSFVNSPSISNTSSKPWAMNRRNPAQQSLIKEKVLGRRSTMLAMATSGSSTSVPFGLMHRQALNQQAKDGRVTGATRSAGFGLTVICVFVVIDLVCGVGTSTKTQDFDITNGVTASGIKSGWKGGG